MADVFETLLLLALPASGKSEVRRFLTAENPHQYHIGPTVQLDDYPYVHLQILVDQALASLGHPQVYHQNNPEAGGNGPFLDPRELGGLIHLLNEDYQELQRGEPERPLQPGLRLLERFDAASQRAGVRPKFLDISAELRQQVAQAIDEEARKFFAEKAAACPADLKGKTVVIEFARGGPPGQDMPLPPGLGYAGSLPHLSPDLLRRAAMLYIWVTPEESRRKNRERARPDGAGSILFHGTPEAVMEAEYSRCDMAFLLEQAPLPGTVRVSTSSGDFDVPVARFDNRKDLTTFVRRDRASWSPEEVQALHRGLQDACAALWKRWRELHPSD